MHYSNIAIIIILVPRELPDEVYIYGNVPRAWARLASLFYKDRPIGALSPREKKATYNRGLPIRTQHSTSDEDSEEELNAMRTLSLHKRYVVL